MPSLGFSGSNLAVVAYAEVDGTAGASTATNSGVATTRVGLGNFVVVLPTGLTQNVARDLIFIQAKASNTSTQPVTAVPVISFLDDTLDATKTIFFFGETVLGTASTKVDSSFSILILRTTISPPAGAPA